jgi:multimeric flavodoxin WrbA
MRIVTINGQNHKGSSYHMGRILADKLAADEDITEFFLSRDLPHFCRGCYACLEDETKCPYWNEKRTILDAMKGADLLILTSPNYCLAPSGAMKSFLDMMFDYWMVHRPKGWMFQKRAVVLCASAGASCRKAMGPIKDSLFFWGVPYIRTYGLAVQAAGWNNVSPEKKEKIERTLTRLASGLSCDRPPRVGIKTRLIFFVMRSMHSAGKDSSPAERRYWEAHGWLGKDRPWRSG